MMDDPEALARYPHVERLPVLGIMTTFATDDAAVMAAILDTYGRRAGHGAGEGMPAPEAEADPVVRIAVRPEADVPVPGAGGMYRVPAPTRLLLAAPGVAGSADAERGRSAALVAPGVVADRDRFVREVLEPLTLFLLGFRDRQPLHAAAIARGGGAILLAGPSGAGKSTLTYAAYRQGFSVLADEPVYIQLRPRLRVWGRSARLHLPPEARERFPELRRLAPTRLPTGKTKLVVDTEPGSRSADRACLCLLRRDVAGAARLEPVEPIRAVQALTARFDPGFDLFADTIAERIARVAEGGAWALTLSDDPRDALPLLAEIAATLERSR